MIPQRRRFKDLDEQHILALAISSEEDDARIYRGFAARLRDDFPKTAALFDDMAKEEDSHRAALIALHQERFGETIPLSAANMWQGSTADDQRGWRIP